MKFADIRLQELELLLAQCKREGIHPQTVIFTIADTDHPSMTGHLSAMKLGVGGLSWPMGPMATHNKKP